MSRLVLCPVCHRHVKNNDDSCPFCRNTMPVRHALALAGAVVLAACSGNVDVDAAGGGPNASGSSASSSSTSKGWSSNVGVMYGLVYMSSSESTSPAASSSSAAASSSSPAVSSSQSSSSQWSTNIVPPYGLPPGP